MKEKLELKHISPYLPYGLKVKNDKQDYIRKMRMEESDCSDDTWVKEVLKRPELKPILRPLSDITKEIEHNGMRFTPVETYVGLSQLKEVSEGNSINIGFAKYNTVSFLFEHHFDIFGLIDKGLAIDVNTINH